MVSDTRSRTFCSPNQAETSVVFIIACVGAPPGELGVRTAGDASGAAADGGPGGAGKGANSVGRAPCSVASDTGAGTSNPREGGGGTSLGGKGGTSANAGSGAQPFEWGDAGTGIESYPGTASTRGVCTSGRHPFVRADGGPDAVARGGGGAEASMVGGDACPANPGGGGGGGGRECRK